MISDFSLCNSMKWWLCCCFTACFWCCFDSSSQLKHHVLVFYLFIRVSKHSFYIDSNILFNEIIIHFQWYTTSLNRSFQTIFRSIFRCLLISHFFMKNKTKITHFYTMFYIASMKKQKFFVVLKGKSEQIFHIWKLLHLLETIQFLFFLHFYDLRIGVFWI